ncbi:hypothetical protein [Salinibacterium sp. M195]|uniref:DUF7882 family protein n=1 Tax=Salinibacterium sp. M195 TaxID=2583374 RepID=UPI001C6357CE|nr:hypothetical protein [Salinibacterium sp. M195]QYH36250.1 hypothetical protein FFT87_09950 [Salinibacterium sp. M195]
MGELIYGSGTRYSIEDRTLAHIRVVTGARLRRHESFYLSWVSTNDPDMGRVSVWLSPSIPLQFHFFGNTPPKINPDWISALELNAAGDRGMVIMTEAEATNYIRQRPPLD